MVSDFRVLFIHSPIIVGQCSRTVILNIQSKEFFRLFLTWQVFSPNDHVFHLLKTKLRVKNPLK